MRRLASGCVGVAALVCAACSGSTAGIGSDPPIVGSDGGGPPPGAGPAVTIHLRGSSAPVTHDDGLSGETPIAQKVTVRSLTLLRSADDPAPLHVFDLGASAIEAGLGDGQDTAIATVAMRGLAAGTFTIARVGVTFVRYSVAATMHSSGVAVPGQYDNLQVLSDGAVVDGQTHGKGWYRFAFAVGCVEYGALTGDGAPLPPSSGGTFTLDTSQAQAAYVFPVNVAIDPAATSAVSLVFEVSTFEDFRWQDESQPGYASGVYDTTPTSYEPVKSFGANGFRLLVQ